MAKFGQGQKQNKAGRPKNEVVLKLNDFKALFAESGGPLIKKCISMALEGNERALQICIDRLVPKMREMEKSEGQTVLEMLNAGRLKVDTTVEPVSLSEPKAQIESETEGNL